ncbi:DUF5819 family protein [Streptomyces flavidovirens]|uniref:DUF5819 family protein n=1 Tax=Streptomyces flavidovirens TaxID=67298 RepID=UPI003420C4B0
MITETFKNRATALLAGATICVFVAHFAMTALYLTPDNHTKRATAKQVNDYLLPYFDQNWRLFAPDPMEEDLGIMVRARSDDGSAPTPFMDITTPMLNRSHHRAFGDRLARMQSGTLQAFQDAEFFVRQQLLKADPERDPKAPISERDLRRVRPEAREMYTVALRHLHSLAGLKAREEWGRVTAVQIRIGTHIYPRFDDRHNRGPGEVSYRDLGWQNLPGKEA